MRIITEINLTEYRRFLICEEKAPATIKKYMRDIREFALWTEGKDIGKAEVLEYKARLISRYAPASVNATLSSINCFFEYMCWHELKVKKLKIQKSLFTTDDRELTKAEYERLLSVAKQRKDDRLYLLMQTICATGLRISELSYITVEAVCCGVADICNKGKRRRIFIPEKLCRMLRMYVKTHHRKCGAVFVTKNGHPLDRSNIWAAMKKLCHEAHVAPKKVYPHNLRHLFARTYYSVHKDIVRLADILGHTSVNTTRIYTIENGETHRKQIQKLDLLRC